MQIYLIIGFLVSAFHIWYYRFHLNLPSKKTDSIGGLIGPFIWPAQIALTLFILFSKKKSND